MKSYSQYKKEAFRDKKLKAAYDALEPEFEIAKAIIRARIDNKITQKELAKRMNTTQSVISRVEQAKTSPSISFLKRLAQALNTSLSVQFK